MIEIQRMYSTLMNSARDTRKIKSAWKQYKECILHSRTVLEIQEKIMSVIGIERMFSTLKYSVRDSRKIKWAR